MKRIGSLISPLVKDLGIEGSVSLEDLRKEWPRLFGEPLSLHMQPSGLKDNELLVMVDSPAWLQQISFYKDEILSKLGNYKVKSVRLRLGRLIAQKQARPFYPPVKTAPISSDDARFIDDTVSEMEDPDLRENIKKVMEKAFSRRLR